MAKGAYESKLAPLRVKAPPMRMLPDDPVWQPIETAPTNGTPVDLWVRHIDGIQFREADMVLVDKTVWRRTCGRVLMSDLDAVLTPTHWMLPPDPPIAAGHTE